MKFHCDRCKTRYSIADDRVRGKILKIRCKSCSAVITVREGMPGGDGSAAVRAPATSETPPEASPLKGAFHQVMAPVSPSASDSFQAPATLEEEWYVSRDGTQHGPFSLQDAKDWVKQQPPGAELWCWSEDFDDWLPVEKVSHFRTMRRPATATDPTVAPAVAMGSGGSVPVAASPTVEPTPRPRFEATMERIEPQPPAPRPGNGVGAAAGAGPQPGGPSAIDNARDPVDELADDIDFDIGEASRVVNLSMLQRDAEAQGAGAMEPGGNRLPGVGRLGKGSGSVAAIEQTAGVARMPPLSDEILVDAKPEILTAKPRSPVMPLLIGGGVLVALAVVIAFVAMSGGDDQNPVRKSGARADIYVQRVESLDFQFGGDRSATPTKKPGEGEPAADKLATPGKSSGKRRGRSPGRKVAVANPNSKPAARKEVVPTAEQDPELPSELSPADITRVSRRYQMSTTRCYERALKKDPFLKVRKLDVVITVAPSGVVSNLRMSSQGGPVLTACLQHRIRGWAFPKSAKGITTQISIVFQAR